MNVIKMNLGHTLGKQKLLILRNFYSNNWHIVFLKICAFVNDNDIEIMQSKFATQWK